MPLRSVVVVCLVLVLVPAIYADTLDFTPTTSGPLASNPFTTPAGFIITGYYWKSSLNNGHGGWTSSGVLLWGRNDTAAQSTDHGIGVCNPIETMAGCQVINGDLNELSNEITPELIQISKPANVQDWTGIGLSSLDRNGGTPGTKLERGQVLASNLDVGNSANKSFFPSVLVSSANVTLLCSFAEGIVHEPGCTTAPGGPSNTDVEPDITFAPNSSTYLYLQSFDWSGSPPLSNNNDYLVRGIDVPTKVPEPGSLLLLGSGLTAVVAALRRKSPK